MTGPVVLLLRLLAMGALYAFLGVALWIMWQALRGASDAASLGRVPAMRLEIRQKGHPSVARSFAQAEVIIGRDPHSDISLNDKALSARHARLSFHDGQWWLDDLGSTNGTRLNRDRSVGATVLMTGDEIKCGSTRFLVTLPSGGDLRLGKRGVQDE